MQREANVVLVRTMLQARICLQLVSLGELPKGFLLIVLSQNSRDEDGISYKLAIENLAKYSRDVVHLIQKKSLMRSVIKLLAIEFLVKLRGGKWFIASIDYIPLAFVLKILCERRIYTFDDGSVNINKKSSYYAFGGFDGNRFARILKFLFPEGTALWYRKRIIKHYTIYPNRSNIVNSERIHLIKIASNFDDGLLERCSAFDQCVVLFLGAVYHEGEIGRWRESVVKEMINHVDLYLPHPRGRSEFDCNKGAFSAEDYFDAFLILGKSLLIIHFGSSSLLNYEGKVDSILLVKESEIAEIIKLINNFKKII